MKNYMLSLTVLLANALSFGQISITKNDFTEKVETFNLSLCDGPDYGVQLKINDKIKKYDKIVVALVYREIGESDKEFSNYRYTGFNEEMYYYPTSKAFGVQFGDEKDIKIVLYSNSTTKKYRFINKSEYCNYSTRKYLLMHEYKIEVRGYVKTGSESYWDGNTLKERNLFTYSKTFMETPVFTFKCSIPDKDAWNTMASEKLKADYKEYMDRGVNNILTGYWNNAESNFRQASVLYKEDELSSWMVKEIGSFQERHQKIIRDNTVPYVGLNKLGSSYKIVWKHLLENRRFKELKNFEEKVLEIGLEEKKVLKKTLKGVTDPEKIIEIVNN